MTARKFQLTFTPNGYAVVNTENGAVLWAGCSRYSGIEVAAKANQEATERDRSPLFDLHPDTGAASRL